MSPVTFRFCPICATALAWQLYAGARRPVCPACGYVQFQDPKVAVVGLVEDGGHVLLVRRARQPAQGKWALPGGFMDAGEMPMAALQREVLEETSLLVEVGALIDIYPQWTVDDEISGIVLAYRCVPARGLATEARAGDDALECRWFGADDVDALLPAELAFDSTHELLARWRNSAR